MAKIPHRDRYAPPTNARGELKLTDLQRDILSVLTRYRYLRGPFIAALLETPFNTKFRHRLSELYDYAYVTLPYSERQRKFIGYRASLIYEITEKGIKALQRVGAYDYNPVAPLHPTRTEKSDRFPHSLLICDVLAGIEVGALQSGARFISQGDITKADLETPPIAIRYDKMVNKKWVDPKAVSIEPDALFAIESDGVKSYIALEADCATESDWRSTLDRSSYMRKVLQYEQLIKTGLHHKHWGIPHVNVLNVTISDLNMRDLMDLTEQLLGSSTKMLFGTHSHFEQENSPKPDGAMFTRPYLRVGHPPYYLKREKAATKAA